MSRATHLLRDTFTYSEPSGADSHGDPTWGAPTTARCYVHKRYQRVQGVEGDTRSVETVLYTEVALALGSRVWLPGEATTATPKVVLSVVKSARPDGSYALWEIGL